MTICLQTNKPMRSLSILCCSVIVSAFGEFKQEFLAAANFVIQQHAQYGCLDILRYSWDTF